MGVELNRVIEQVGKDKGIDKKILIEALETALLTAAKKKYGPNKEIEARYNPEIGEVELFQFKTVVEEVKDPASEITAEEAQKLDPEAQIGDSLGLKLDASEFGRIAAQTAKQVIIQRVRDAERENIFSEFKGRAGELVHGIVKRLDKGAVVMDLGRTEAILPPKEQVPHESYRPGDRLRAYLVEVRKSTRGPQIVLSRTHPGLLIKLFEMEVPEIAEGLVRIKSAAREPGGRAKIAVASDDPDIDPVGACVGMKGSRVQAVVQELRGEKIDIVAWSDDPVRLICNALSPAQLAKVIVDEANHAMEVIVPDDQLSLAIGKRGQNVRLAAKLTGWRIDIKSESRVEKLSQEALTAMMRISAVDETAAANLVASGFHTLDQVAEATPELLAQIPGLDTEKAAEVVAEARRLVAEDAAARAAEEGAAPPMEAARLAAHD
ncbi:MAG: transcription termination/antitermination protein NusA [Deltaproteobacteria bacterium]|nr:transcription termination/antitermination protein NusA [Deltaproteobacteria bacterium]MBI3077959.1 transcription termination/antitermination protein NusA [Deltaproteobacteria bacterium]